MKLKLLLILLIITQILSLAGCWNSREIDTLAITVGTGVDKIDDKYILTQQIINPQAIASKKATLVSPVIIYTESGQDLFEAKRKIITESPRKIYNSHLRLVVISEDVARKGIKDILDFFARGEEYRNDFYFLIAKDTTAKDILSILTPIEMIPSIGMYYSLEASNKNFATTKETKIIELLNTIISDGQNPVISGIEIIDKKNIDTSIDILKYTDVLPNLKFTSLGAFKNDKLVGWLNENESKGYNLIIGNIKSTIEYVYYKNGAKITDEVINEKSDINVHLVNGKPYINVEISVLQNIETIEGEYNISTVENLDIISKLCEERLKSLCLESINKAQSELKTDIFGFGNKIYKKYPKIWEKIKNNWDEEFVNLPVNVNVKVKTNTLGQLFGTLFTKEGN